jgi:hypothetical protein
MSHDIIKRIRISDKKVFITCAANNVYPRYFEEWESESLSKILQLQGQEALDIEIFKQYENGNFQRGRNKYTRALHILLNMPDYAQYNWRRSDIDYNLFYANREQPGYQRILIKALQSKLPKDKFIISKLHDYKLCYLFKITRRSAKFCFDKAKAKIFHFENDCDRLKKSFTGSEYWNIERIC